MRCMRFKVCLIFVIMLASTDLGFAQESSRPIEVNGDQVEYFPKERKVVGIGNVSIDYQGIRLTCDKIIVYTDTKEAEAEGHVRLRTATGEVMGQKIKYNFDTKEGEIIKARAKSGEWYTGGEKAEIESDGLIRIEEGYITSCDLQKPHYKISSKRVVIYPDNRIVAKDVIFKVGRVPVAYLPRYDYSLKSDWPSLNVIPGKKNRWGLFLLTNYRYVINPQHNLTLKIDEREKWGLAEGVDYKYGLGNYGNGLLRTYYTYQRDRDRNQPIKYKEERYRFQLRHHWDTGDEIAGILEYHKLSDSEMTKDYFYREEYEREPSPKSYLYLLNRQPEYSLSFLMRKRVNRFQSIVEKLPQLRLDLKDQKLSESLYFKTDTSVTNLNSKTGNSAEDKDVVRFDTFNKLTSPLRFIDFLSVSPYVGMRDTFYSKDSGGDEDELRTAFYTGVDISTKFLRTYEISGRFLGVEINKLQHIVTPTIEYEYIHEPSISPGNLQQFDDIDNIDRKSTFGLGLENRWKTKRLKNGKLKTRDLGYILLTGDYLYKPEQGSRFSNVKGDLEFTPYEWLRIESDTLYDPDSKDFQNWNLDFYMDRGEDWRLGFGSRYWQETEHELTSQLHFRLNHEWAFRLFGRFDLKEVESNGNKIINRFQTKELTIIKDLHCWLAEINLDVDRDGGTTLWFVMKLKASPKVPFDLKDYYAPPKMN